MNSTQNQTCQTMNISYAHIKYQGNNIMGGILVELPHLKNLYNF